MRNATFCLSILWAVLASSSSPGDEPTGRITGKVTEDKSGQPIAQAKIIAVTGMSQDRPGWQYAPAEAHSNKSGQYELAVPIGHVQLYLPEPPPGYWIVPVPDKGRGNFKWVENLSVTRESPTAQRDFVLKKGTTWNVKVSTADGQPVARAPVMTFRQSDVSNAKDMTDVVGTGHFTTPVDGGTLTLNIVNIGQDALALPCSLEKPVTLNILSDFDPSTAKIAQPIEAGKPVNLIDNAGRTASIEGAAVSMENGAPLLHLVAVKAIPLGDLTGRVVDAQGQPVRDALVVCMGLLTPANATCRTDPGGRFGFRRLWSFPGEDSMYRLYVVKDGYAGLDMKEQTYVPNVGAPRQLPEPLVLTLGCSIRLRIVGPDGKPLEGAWVEPEGIGSRLAQFTKSDQAGLCTVSNLPEGICAVNFKFGEFAAREKLVLSATTADASPVTVRLTDFSKPVNRPLAELKPLQAGEQAPELSVSGWTDGKDRRLSDYKGEVVVIEFLGVYGGPSTLTQVAVLKSLDERFTGKVAFVGIHYPGVDLEQVKKLLELRQCKVPVGLDKGADATDGETARRYGVRGYPTIIVDRRGGVAFNSYAEVGDREKMMAQMNSLAEELNIPWPIDKDVSEEEILARLQKMRELKLSKEIEKALATQ